MLLLLQVEEELKSACKRKSLQLQEMGRRERLLKSDVDRAQGQVGERDEVFLWCGLQALKVLLPSWERASVEGRL